MTEDQRLLHAICADPSDDLARLVYADWLEEMNTDTDHAEFIRLQIEHARLYPPGSSDEKGRMANEARQFVLLERRLGSGHLPSTFAGGGVDLGIYANGYRWAHGLSPVMERPWKYQWHAFRRGFCVRAECSFARWQQYGALVVTRLPIEEVWTEKTPATVAPVAPSNQQTRCQWLLEDYVGQGWSSLPLELFQIVSVMAIRSDMVGAMFLPGCTFDNRDRAKRALRLALPVWARQKAGLEKQVVGPGVSHVDF